MRLRNRLWIGALFALGFLVSAPVFADVAERVPELGPPPELTAFVGKPLTRIDVVARGKRFRAAQAIEQAHSGQSMSTELVRRVLRELAESGRYAEVRATVEPDGAGVRLVLDVLPRRVIASLDLDTPAFSEEDVLRVARVRPGDELTEPELTAIEARLRALYVRRGYHAARVGVGVVDTDDPLAVVLGISAVPGKKSVIAQRRFAVWPDPVAPGMAEALADYAVGSGDRADEDALDDADRALEAELRRRGFQRAKVAHRLRDQGVDSALFVEVHAFARVRIRFEGNRHFDGEQLASALELETSDDLARVTLLDKLKKFYVEHGFLDVALSAEERGSDRDAIKDLVFHIQEGTLVRVVARQYACLTGTRGPREIGSEIDSYLSELSGGGLFGPVDPRSVDQLYGPTTGTGPRVAPSDASPWSSYVPEVYDRAVKHVQDLYRSEGYLSALVGPTQVLRRACALRSPPGVCIPKGPPLRSNSQCRYDEVGIPSEEALQSSALSCVPDRTRGIFCEPNIALSIPVKLGPRSFLYDIAFEGNRAITQKELASVAELELGMPLSQVEIERARRRILDAYAERGFAFAELETALDLSLDHTRARVRFLIGEREAVHVAQIVVRGARGTSESLIRSRVALEVGGLYQRSLVRKTEERLATLGVFSSINVGFEDPYIPAREKVVVINLEQRRPQYLDVRPGFSTGEGFRTVFEYGHRNLAGQAVALTLRSQLGYLPTAFILESDVRTKYDELDVGERLERRNTVSIEFPSIGLGPLFRLRVEGVDVRDNARDYGLSKDAGIVTLTLRPDRRLWFELGSSLERNDATIFGQAQKEALTQYLQQHPEQQSTFRVPAGTTLAIAERFFVTWDRRDSPLDASSGTFFSAGVEHVHATPIGDSAGFSNTAPTSPFDPTTSDFMRYTNRLGAYLRLDAQGLALAASFRWGIIQHLLKGSQTYPDRLFFMGGVDSLRGFLQDSLIPEDIAQRLLNNTSALGLRDVVIRGGDFFINPRLELRIPLGGSVQTALFLDSGNLWTDPRRVRLSSLRYAIGTGLRVATPIGPLVFDYGFNVDRVLDRLFPNRDAQRYWEDIGAFHFSIGLF